MNHPNQHSQGHPPQPQQQQFQQGQQGQQGQPAQADHHARYQAQFQHAPAPVGPPPKVSTPPAVLTPFVSMSREFRALFAVPLAFVGGVFGAIILSGTLVLAMWWLETNAEAAPIEEEEFFLEFQPGALTKLGVKPTEIPEKAINEETRTPEDVEKEAVTEEETPPEIEDEKKKPVKEKAKDDRPVNKNDDAKISDKNRTDNNPYEDDLPNNIDPTGDPFGDPNGWSDLKKDGDPWATSVMSALNNMKVPAWAGKLPVGKPYRFKLKVCKDGSVGAVMSKGSSGNKDLDDAVRGEIERLKLARPPAHVAKMMKANCVTLKYTFAWKSGYVK